MKKSLIALLLILSLVLVSCATRNHEVALSQNKNIVGKNGIKRPDWVLHDQSNSTKHYIAAYGQGRTFETSMQRAKLSADAEMAIWINTTVSTIRDRYIEEYQDNSTDKFMDKFVYSANEQGSAMLTGVQEIDFWEDTEGGVWVLICLPLENVKNQISSVIAKTCADTSLFENITSAEQTLERLNAVLDEYFPTN